MKRLCEAVSARGTQCRRSALDGEQTCARHCIGYVAPKRAAKVSTASAGEADHGAMPHGTTTEPDQLDPVESVEAVGTLLTLPGVDIGARAPERSKRQAQLGQWFTPSWLAAETVRLVDVRDRVVLEPSAGDGALVRAALDAGATAVIAVELDPDMCARLEQRFAGECVRVVRGDFLTVSTNHLGREWTVIVGNPPYDKGADSLHLARIAQLIEWRESCGEEAVYAALLLRTVALHSGGRFENVWSSLAVYAMRPCADRIPFLAAGEEGEAGKIDVSAFRVGLRVPGERELVEWLREPETALARTA